MVERYGDGSKWGIRIEYSFDGPKLLGTGGALIRALPKLGDAFYVLYGDSYLPIDYQAVGRSLLATSIKGNTGGKSAKGGWRRGRPFFPLDGGSGTAGSSSQTTVLGSTATA